MRKQPVVRQVPLPINAYDKPAFQKIITIEVPKKKKGKRGYNSSEDDHENDQRWKKHWKEASWIQEGLDQIDDNSKEAFYHNALALDNTTFFNGYEEMLGDKSNLGFDARKHQQYLGDEANVRNQFHDNVSDLLKNYEGTGEENQFVYEKFIKMNPDYESWYQVGKINPKEICVEC